MSFKGLADFPSPKKNLHTHTHHTQFTISHSATFTLFLLLTCCAAEEHLAELMPIFEELRAKGEVGNAYPMHVGSTSGPTVHMAHANPNTCHWVMFSNLLQLCMFLVKVFVCVFLFKTYCMAFSTLLCFFFYWCYRTIPSTHFSLNE